MSHKRLIWQEISDLALRLGQQKNLGETDVTELTQLLGKLGKVQFKANRLFEAQLDQQRGTLGSLRSALVRQDEIVSGLEKSHKKEVEMARHSLLLAILPITDGVETALAEGRQQLLLLGSDDNARRILESWLEGVEVVHRHMLDVLSRAGVEPMLSVGSMFDPHRHVATGVDASNKAAVGIITAEELRGYLVGGEVLRYAEVIVSRPVSVSARERQAEPIV